MLTAFKALGEIIVGAKQKRDVEYQEFLSFYRELVESLPTEACKRFGNLSVKVIKQDGNKEANYGIELTVADFLWWKGVLENDEIRLDSTTNQIKNAMLDKLTRIAEVNNLEPEARKSLLAILIDAKEST